MKIQEIKDLIQEREREREQEEKRAITFIGAWGFLTLPLIGVIYLLIENSEEWEEHKTKIWISFAVVAFFFVISFIWWIKSNKKRKEIVRQIEDYKKQIQEIEKQ